MELAEALRRRRMVRNFEPDPVPDDVVESVVAAGRRAPAAGNTDALDVVLLRGPDETARYWDATLAPERRTTFRWPGLLHAPALLIVCTAPDAYVDRYSEPDKAQTGLGVDATRWTVPYWHVDAGMAVALMLLAAIDEGLGALFFGIFDHERAVRDALSIPSAVVPIGTIALGYPAPDEPGRSSTRDRRDLDDVLHRGRW